MANYSVFNVRRRHEWLAKPLKKKRIKRRTAKRVGLLDAMERRAKPEPEPATETDEEGDEQEAPTAAAAADGD